MNKKLNHKSR